MNKAIGPASILIAVLTPANAEMVPIASGGQWTAYADTVSSTKDCVVQAAVNGGRFTLSGASDYPGVLRLNLYKPTWRIPRINVPIELSFPDGVNYNFLGTGIQSIVHADISATDVKSFIHHFTADSFATMTLPEGHEAPWQLDLTGTTPTIRAMARCLESAQNWLPLPFPQRPAPIPPQAEQVAPPAPLPVAPKPPPAQATDNNTGPPPVQEPPAVLQPSPQPEESQEDRFMMIVQTFGKSFDDAPNDLLKGAARQKRKAAICSMLDSLLVHGWTGTISDLSSNSAGNTNGRKS